MPVRKGLISCYVFNFSSMYTRATPSPFDSVSYNISGGTISPLDPENIYAEPDPSYYLSLIIISCFIGYICTIVYGIPSNLYVVYRMCKLSRKSSDMYRFVWKLTVETCSEFFC